MAWKITHDYLHEASDIYSRAGNVKSPDMLVGDTKTFILKDDDDETCYSGRFDAAAEELDEGDPNSLYSALKFGEHDAGCTTLWVGGDCVYG